MAFGDFTVTRASTKNVLGSAGLYVSVANNVPAFEFNTDGSYRGLLVEPGATNLMIQSQNLELALNSQSNSVVTANSAVAPDGTTTADTLSFSNTNGFRLRTFSITSGTTYTASVFIKNNTYASGETLRLNISDGVAGPTTVTITPFTNTVSSSGNPAWTNRTATIQDVGNGWYRVTVSGTAGNTGTGWVEFANSSVANKEIFVWQLQFETGSVATSPIVTTAGTASRVADVVTLTGASSLIGQTGGGVLYVEVEWRRASGQQFLLSASDNTDNNRFQLFVSVPGDLTMLGISNGVSQTLQSVASSGFTGTQKIGFRYATNDAALYRNGSSVSTDTVFDISALGTLSKINIGARHNETDFANMWIRSVALFATPLTNAQLASLTA